MDIVEFNQHLGYATPKDMVDNFSKTLAMYCVTDGYEANVSVRKRSNKLIYVVTPKDNSSIEYLIEALAMRSTIVHENLFKFRTKRYDENSLSVEIYKGQY